jgi:hypothetical protein
LAFRAPSAPTGKSRFSGPDAQAALSIPDQWAQKSRDKPGSWSKP